MQSAIPRYPSLAKSSTGLHINLATGTAPDGISLFVLTLRRSLYLRQLSALLSQCRSVKALFKPVWLTSLGITYVAADSEASSASSRAHRAIAQLLNSDMMTAFL